MFLARYLRYYYAFGSPMPGRCGTIPKCVITSFVDTVAVYIKNEDFSSGSTGGLTVGPRSRTVTNPTGSQLHLVSLWTTKPLANTSST